jgi:hypothetical protein
MSEPLRCCASTDSSVALAEDPNRGNRPPTLRGGVDCAYGSATTTFSAVRAPAGARALA